MEAHIKTGALVANYLKTELHVKIESCTEVDHSVILRNEDDSPFNLLEWVGREQAMGEDSVLGRIFKERKFSLVKTIKLPGEAGGSSCMATCTTGLSRKSSPQTSCASAIASVARSWRKVG